MLEEAVTFVGDRIGLTAEADVRRRRNKTIDWGDGVKRNIRDDMTLRNHSEAMQSSVNDNQPRSLHNKKINSLRLHY